MNADSMVFVLRLSRASVALLALLFALGVHANAPLPALTGPVVDRAEILSGQTEDQLSNILSALNLQTSTQLAVLTVPELSGEPIEAFTLRVVESWKLGRRESDRGILLAVALKERKIRIEVGQGAEGDLPDAYARRVIDSMIPAMRTGNYDEAIKVGVQGILSRVAPDFLSASTAELSVPKERTRSSSAPFGITVHLIFLIIVIVFGSLARLGFFGPGVLRASRRGSGLHWGGGWGGGGSFGRGGGGFGGGGGGFSGGGASGSW